MKTADIVKGFREVVQDLLVPELKAIKIELEHHNEQFREITKRFEEVNKRFEEIDERFEKIDQRFERVFKELEDLKIGQKEILAKLDLEKRLTRIETLLEKEGKLFSVIKEEKGSYK